MARINADGTPDTTFGATGAAHPDFGGNEFGRAIALQPDGKILIAGYSTSSSGEEAIVARLDNPQGAPDASFHGDGAAFEDLVGSSSSAVAVALATDGTIETAGTNFTSFGAAEHLRVGDASSSGFFEGTSDNLGVDSAATAIVAEPGGKRVVAGFTNLHGTYDFVVEQFSGLNLAATFGAGGRQIVDFGGTDEARAMVLEPDGKIILAGTTTAGSGATATSKIAVARLQPNGQLDSTFGSNGTEVIGMSGAQLQGNAVGLEANGDIIVGGTITPAGSTRHELLAIRLHGDLTGTASTDSGATGSSGGNGGATGNGASVSKSAPMCMGKRATIIGTPGNDHLKAPRKPT